MFLRKFTIDGRIAPLSMSGTGEAAGGGGAAAGGAAAGGAPAGGAPAPAAGAAPTSYTFTSDKPFAEQLPEKYRNDPNFRDIKSIDGILDGYVNAQKLVGADKIALPKDGDEQAFSDFYNKLGRPETADKYNIGKRADGSDYGEQDKAFQSKILPVLHKAGLTQKQFDAIRPAWDAMAAEAAGAGTKAAETYAAQQVESLKTEWGAAFDDNMSDAQAAIQHLGNEDLIKELNIVKDGKATGDNAQLLKVMAKIGKQMREDGVIGRGGEAQGGALTPDQARDAIKGKRADKDFMAKYGSKDHPEHAQAVQEMTKLYEFAYPPEQ